jgi:hypothetical protein
VPTPSLARLALLFQLARRPLVLAGAALLLPAAALGATLTVEDPLISRAQCAAGASESLALDWDLGSSSGATIELLGSDASGCSESDATTAVLADGISTSQTYYPASGDTAIHLDDLLSAAGKDAGTCDGDDFRAYVCVRLLDSSGAEVVTASAAVTWQLERPPPPTGVSVAIGENALHVGWSAGTTTTGATASTESYGVFAASGGVIASSAETTDTSLRLGGLENGTTYDVWVVAYSEAGNPSDASELVAGTPQPVYDFYEVYRAAGGTETGGCAQGPAGLLGFALAALPLLLRRLSSSRPRVIRSCANQRAQRPTRVSPPDPE